MERIDSEQKLELGKYEFFPNENEEEVTEDQILEDLLEMLRKFEGCE